MTYMHHLGERLVDHPQAVEDMIDLAFRMHGGVSRLTCHVCAGACSGGWRALMFDDGRYHAVCTNCLEEKNL